MKLPRLPYGDRIRKVTQVQFGGYNHTRGAGDGELYDMQNLSGKDWPVLSVRNPRESVRGITKGNGMYAMDQLAWVDGDTLFYGGRAVGLVTDTVKQFASIGRLLVILPDMVCYDTREDDIPEGLRKTTKEALDEYGRQHAGDLTIGDLGGVWIPNEDGIEQYDLYYWDGTGWAKVGHPSFGPLASEAVGQLHSGGMYLQDGYYTDEPAEANTIRTRTQINYNDYFQPGDAVHIRAYKVVWPEETEDPPEETEDPPEETENQPEETEDPPEYVTDEQLLQSGWQLKTVVDKTAVIREISEDGKMLRFYENTFDIEPEEFIQEAAQEDRRAIWMNPHYVALGSHVDAELFRFRLEQNTEIEITAAGASAAVGKWFVEEAPGTSTHGTAYGKTAYEITAAEYLSADACIKLTLRMWRVQRVESCAKIVLTREVPELDYICGNDNRIWGCKGDTIYACKLGDPWNWNVFDGLASDSWSVDAGTPGPFTACVSYLGYPIFFKENEIFKVYGKYPSNYELISSPAQGVMEGSAASLAVAASTLFYLSRTGPCAYTGSQPVSLAAPFGEERWQWGVGGSDGERYYLSMSRVGQGYCSMFVYEPRLNMWFREDGTAAIAFAQMDGLLCMSDTTDEIFRADAPGETETIDWFAEFGDFTDKDPNRKGVSKIQVRIELDAGASADLKIKYDSGASWETIWHMTAGKKQSFYIPIIPRRCDHYRLKLEGRGQARLYSLAREQYSGSEIH